MIHLQEPVLFDKFSGVRLRRNKFRRRLLKPKPGSICALRAAIAAKIRIHIQRENDVARQKHRRTSQQDFRRYGTLAQRPKNQEEHRVHNHIV